MIIPSRVQDITTSTGIGIVTLSNTPPISRRGFSTVAIGETVPYVIASKVANEWEEGYGKRTSETSFERTKVTDSSNAGNAVNFSVGQKDIFIDAHGSYLQSLGPRDVPFSQSIPLSISGDAYMAPATVSSPLTFTPAASAVRGALVYLRLVADGINAPNFSAFKEWGGSLGYDNRAGIPNQVQFFHDGVDSWVSISQAIGAAPAPMPDTTAPSMSGSIASSNITSSGFTTAWAAGSDNIAVAYYEHSIDGGTSYTNVGNALTRTVSGLTANTAHQVRVRAVDAAGNKSAPLSLVVTTSGDEVVIPGDTTAPTMNGAISVTNITQTGYVASWPAASDAVGVAGYEFSRNGGTSYVDLGNVLTTTVSNASAGSSEQLRARAYDAAGNRAAPLSTSVTMQSAPVGPGVEEDGRMVLLDRVAEEGTAVPYGYYPTVTATTFGASNPGGMVAKSLSANNDGFIQVQTTRGSQMDAMLFAKSVNAVGSLASWEYAIFLKASGDYIAYASGSVASPYVGAVRVGGDKLRLRREGASIVAEIERTDGTIHLLKTWNGAATGQLFFGAAFAATANTEGRIHTIRTKGLS